jgi:hypothetical protein
MPRIGWNHDHTRSTEGPHRCSSLMCWGRGTGTSTAPLRHLSVDPRAWLRERRSISLLRMRLRRRWLRAMHQNGLSGLRDIGKGREALDKVDSGVPAEWPIRSERFAIVSGRYLAACRQSRCSEPSFTARNPAPSASGKSRPRAAGRERQLQAIGAHGWREPDGVRMRARRTARSA